MRSSIIGIAAVCFALFPESPLPRVTAISMVSSNMIAVTIETTGLVRGRLMRYTPETGDVLSNVPASNGTLSHDILIRGDQKYALAGPENARIYTILGEITGAPLDTNAADNAASYSVSSPDDADYSSGTRPDTVHRKSKPFNWERWDRFLNRHTVFLVMPRPLADGMRYRIDTTGINIAQTVLRFTNDAKKVISPAVHVPQTGYRPDDPAKRGYLSLWSGSGGGLKYPTGLPFSLIDTATGNIVFSGTAEMGIAANEDERMYRDMNFNYADVWYLDFDPFSTPGNYVLSVSGIGTSYPFDISTNSWLDAFRITMRGYFHQRSGIELGPPYTTYIKPRDHHPADGYLTYLTRERFDIFNPKNHMENYAKMYERKTDIVVSNAWGGWHDAGDWNPRRITHLRAVYPMLSLIELFPDIFAPMTLTIPKDYPLPDILNEVLFEIDCFRRLQNDDGGVGFQLETPDPGTSPVSWATLKGSQLMNAPDAYSSWYYAGTAARAARVIRRYNAKIAEVYAGSALRAMRFAEADLIKSAAAAGKTENDIIPMARDRRNLAALELYALTGDTNYHRLFLKTTQLSRGILFKGEPPAADQRWAGFTYVTLTAYPVDEALRAKAKQLIVDLANTEVSYALNNAFNLSTVFKYYPQANGFYTSPDVSELIWAHYLTKDPLYLRTLVLTQQFTGGGNPDNIVYTTGLGKNPVRRALKVDAMASGTDAPEGLTVFGPYDQVNTQGWSSWIFNSIGSSIFPTFKKWPVTESYCDLSFFIQQNEFVTDMWEGVTYARGYLAARGTK